MLRRAIRGHLGRNNGWQDHYNAACTFAVCMLTPESHRVIEKLNPECKNMYSRDRRLVQLSVHELSGAVVAADSQFAAGQSIWLRRGDQDLDDLRVTPFYTTFIARYLPTPDPAEDFPNPTLLAVSRHVAGLFHQYAALRRSFWQEQGVKPTISSFEDEHTWWRQLREYCHNYRDWGTRWKAINLASSLAGGAMRFDPAMPGSGPDAEPVPVDDPGHPNLPKKSGAVNDEDRVRAWLSKSDTLKQAATKWIRSRNHKFRRLNRKLSEAKIEEALEGIVFFLSAGSPRRALRAQLIATWSAISEYINDSDYNQNAFEPGDEIDRLRYMLVKLRSGEREC